MCLLELWLESQGMCPVVELLGHIVDLFLVFKGFSVLFSRMAVSVYMPTNSIGGFPFLYIFSAFIVYRFFDDGHSDWCEVIPHCSFPLHFSNN